MRGTVAKEIHRICALGGFHPRVVKRRWNRIPWNKRQEALIQLERLATERREMIEERLNAARPR